MELLSLRTHKLNNIQLILYIYIYIYKVKWQIIQ